MSDRKEKGYRKLRRSKLGSVLVIYLIVSLCFNAFLAFLAHMFLQYVLEARIYSEYQAVSYMARMYEHKDSVEDIYALLDAEGRDYFIADRDWRIYHQSGKELSSGMGGQLRLSRIGQNVSLYEDKALRLLRHKNGTLSFDLKGFLTWVSQTGGLQRLADKGATLDIPFWIAANISGENKRIFGKAYFSIDAGDIVFAGAVGLTIAVMVLGLSVIIIYHIVGSIRQQRKMTNLFFMDDVTGERNWMWMQIKGEKLLRKRKNAKNHYVMLSVSFVKYRNFCMCHSIKEGEDVLTKVNRLLIKRLDKKDLCAHHSSASFAVLMKYKDEEELKKFLDDLLKDLEIVDAVHKFCFHIGVSLVSNDKEVGRWPFKYKIVEMEKDYNSACTARDTLSDMDHSAVVFFDEKLIEEQRWIEIVQENQQNALAQEEFVVFYQPKFDPRTDRLCGAEALIRWESPEYGFKGPDTIIPIFERNGFITEIDRYMIRRAARDQKEWVDRGLKCVPVSVNVSRAHFAENNLAEQIRDLVDAEKAPHELIEIELTESAFFDDKTALVNTIKKLKEYGFVVSMDDFGSGYSSLNSLKDMPLDVLKLDAEFFRGEGEEGRGEIVISEALQLAKKLHMRTVAEGVEVQEQVDFLAAKGCDMIQGYYYSKPLPKADYEQCMVAGVALNKKQRSNIKKMMSRSTGH
ncbi:MAG: EAL domain-containing protein [Lachnospiraceae bacterium]|nr:EAL domain-containing protein [Lachnospiraceae bacterium]